MLNVTSAVEVEEKGGRLDVRISNVKNSLTTNSSWIVGDRQLPWRKERTADWLKACKKKSFRVSNENKVYCSFITFLFTHLLSTCSHGFPDASVLWHFIVI